MSGPVWQYVMCHHSASPDSDGMDTDAIERYHTEIKQPPWRDIGYHFLVEGVGAGYHTIKGRPLYMFGSHCPTSGMNRKAVGVCFVGNFDEYPMPAAQMEEGAEHIAGLCYSLKIPTSKIVFHGDFKATACPGRYFPKGSLITRVERLMTQH